LLAVAMWSIRSAMSVTAAPISWNACRVWSTTTAPSSVWRGPSVTTETVRWVSPWISPTRAGHHQVGLDATRRKLAAAVSIVPIVCAAGTLFVPRYCARFSTDPSSTMAATPSTSMRPTTTPKDPNNFVRTETHVETLPCHVALAPRVLR
jgi:hypothetical protein